MRGAAERFTEVSEIRDRRERIRALRQLGEESPVFPQVLKLALDPAVKWLLPRGKVPYKPSPFHDSEALFFKEFRTMYLFLEGGHPTLSQRKREQIFIQLLESLSALDAEMLVLAKDKKLPWTSITKQVVLEAFPGLWEEKKSVEEPEKAA